MISKKPIYVIPIILTVVLFAVAVIITMSFSNPHSSIKINDGIAKDDRHVVSVEGVGSFKTKDKADLIYSNDYSTLYKISDSTYVMLSDLNEQTFPVTDYSAVKSKVFVIENDISENTLNYVANLFNNGYTVERISIKDANGFLVSEEDNFSDDPIKTVVANKGVDTTDKKAIHFVTYDGRMISVLSNNEEEQLELISSYSEGDYNGI